MPKFPRRIACSRFGAAVANERLPFRVKHDPLRKRYAPTCEVKPLRGQQRLREAVFLSFSHQPIHLEDLFHLPSGQWKPLLHWLDMSGLALYFLDRVSELGLLHSLPPFAVEDLQQRLDQNTKRTRGMIEESIAIQRDFQRAGVTYALMKGLSLFPSSVPRPELRHQFDLDYLIEQNSAELARRILERRGYRLHASSGMTLEFKANETPYVSMKDLYKDLSYRAVELHFEEENTAGAGRLKRLERRMIFDLSMPVLSPVDLFLSQGLHAFKDVCSAFFRAAHLLEFYRHVIARGDDDEFWCALRLAAEHDRRASFGIGVVVDLITLMMGDFAPEALTIWTVEILPASVRLWVDLYGRRSVYGTHPGTKLYLLLQRELEASGISSIRPIKKMLLPLRLPPVVIRASSDERLATKIARYQIQMRFLLSRLLFHLVEGLSFLIESYRWRHRLSRVLS